MAMDSVLDTMFLYTNNNILLLKINSWCSSYTKIQGLIKYIYNKLQNKYISQKLKYHSLTFTVKICLIDGSKHLMTFGC